jgi:hypothetical protein
MRTALALVLLTTVAHADTSASEEAQPRPRDLQVFMSRVRTVAVTRNARALAKLVDREFTIGEELPRSYSLSAIRARPAVLDELVTLLDKGRCDVEERRAQCEVHIDGSPSGRRTLTIFLREGGRWRLGVFAPTSDL